MKKIFLAEENHSNHEESHFLIDQNPTLQPVMAVDQALIDINSTGGGGSGFGGGGSELKKPKEAINWASTDVDLEKGELRKENGKEGPSFEEHMPEKNLKNSNLNLLALFQLGSSILMVGILVFSFYDSDLNDLYLFKFKFWVWTLLALVLTHGKRVFDWGKRAMLFLINRSLFSSKKGLCFLVWLIKVINGCCILKLGMIYAQIMSDKSLEGVANSKIFRFINKTLISIAVGCLLWLIKKLFVHLVKSWYILRSYYERIQEALFNQFVIETLSGSKAKSSRLSQAIHHLNKLDPENGPAWTLMWLINILRHGVLSILDEHLLRPMADIDDATWLNSTMNNAKDLATKIFDNVAKKGSQGIYTRDLRQLVLDDDDAWKIFNLFESAFENNYISEPALGNWVRNALIAERPLILTLNDVKAAIDTVDKAVSIKLCAIPGVIWFLILGIDDIHLLVATFFLVLALSIFDKCSRSLSSAPYFFIVRTYDVGDLCRVDKMKMIVKKMKISKIIFRELGNNAEIEYKNSVLARKLLINCNYRYYRRFH